MSVSAPISANLTGSFTREAFAAHLERVKHLPAWWLDRKRAAYERFGPRPTLLERDFNFPPYAELVAELGTIRGLLRTHVPQHEHAHHVRV